MWDIETHLCKHTVPLFDKNLNAVACMPNGNIAMAKDNMIKFYNPQKDEFEKVRSLNFYIK